MEGPPGPEKLPLALLALRSAIGNREPGSDPWTLNPPQISHRATGNRDLVPCSCLPLLIPDLLSLLSAYLPALLPGYREPGSGPDLPAPLLIPCPGIWSLLLHTWDLIQPLYLPPHLPIPCSATGNREPGSGPYSSQTCYREPGTGIWSRLSLPPRPATGNRATGMGRYLSR